MPVVLPHGSHLLPAQHPVATRLVVPEHLQPRESWCSNRRGIAPALRLRPFFPRGSRRMLVRSNRRAIQNHVLQVRVLKRLEHPLPYTAFRQAIKALIHGVPGAKSLRQITPRRTRSRHPNNGVNEQTVILCRGSLAPFSARQQWFKLLPLGSGQFITSCRQHPCHPFSWGLECRKS